MTQQWCSQPGRYDVPCGEPATYSVFWRSTAEDAIPCCTKHLNKALKALRAKTYNGFERTFKVDFLV